MSLADVTPALPELDHMCLTVSYLHNHVTLPLCVIRLLPPSGEHTVGGSVVSRPGLIRQLWLV